MVGELLIILLSLLLYIYYYIVNNDYWKKRGVTSIKPLFPLGIITHELLGRRPAGKNLQVFYEQYQSEKLRFVGGYIVTQPVLIILDLDVFKHILTKDFNHFTDRELLPITHEFMSKHLFSLEGHAWRDMRGKLTPTFTSGKMKNMFVLMERCAEQLVDHIEHSVLPLGVFQVKDLVARFTTDVIATCAFGLDVNCVKDRDNEFFKTGQLMFVPRRSYFFKFLLIKYFPTFAKLIKLDFYNPDMKRLFSQIIMDTVKFRQENNYVRNDFIDLLLKVKENQFLQDEGEDLLQNGQSQLKRTADQREKEQLTVEEMIAQAFVFFAAGFETAASTTSFCLYELAKSPQVQMRLHEEIDRVLEKHGGKVTYQALQEMSYMDQVLNGMRFGKLQVKVGLTAILSKFDISPAPDTPSSVEINPIIIFTVPKHPFNLQISARSLHQTAHLQ